MKLRWGVGVVIVTFVLLVLFFWGRGYWFPGPPSTPAEKGAGAQRAAKGGLFDKTSPPIIH